MLPVGGRFPGNFDLCSFGLMTGFGSGGTRLKMLSSSAFVLLLVLIIITMNKLRVLYSLWQVDLILWMTDWPGVLKEVLVFISFYCLASQSTHLVTSKWDLALFGFLADFSEHSKVPSEPTFEAGPAATFPRGRIASRDSRSRFTADTA